MKIPKALSLERKRRAWELHQKFYKHHEIATELGMNLSAVSRMLARLNNEFKLKLAKDIEDVKSDQIARLEHIAREAYDAWERSKETNKSVRQKKAISNGQQLGITEQTNEAREQYGDPRYLKECREAMAEIRKITGADAAIKFQHSGDKDADAIKLDYSTTKAGFLAKLASLVKPAGAEPVPE